MLRCRGGFPPAPNVGRPRLLPPKCPQPLVGALAYQGFEPEADRISVAPGATDGSRLSQKVLIDVESLLHAI